MGFRGIISLEHQNETAMGYVLFKLRGYVGLTRREAGAVLKFVAENSATPWECIHRNVVPDVLFENPVVAKAKSVARGLEHQANAHTEYTVEQGR